MIKIRPIPAALLYIFGSILLGPTIFLAGFLITPANGDFCDVGVHGSREQRDRDYTLIDTIQTTGAMVMLLLGALALAYLWLNRRRVGPLPVAVLSAGILIIASGYVLILSAAQYGHPTC
ncbi:hypothetical protein IFM12275_17630 [Nocardia sputorum]|uniref:hypothetical protein n=1 Tax=Nocardia TaxID=1817 RepID=UPI00248FA641|nr:hypothetical protein [Nocardia sputorum]BDT91787.1 hypothetical protein IFM12275_17630 [Nocardia sputorum]